MKEALRLRTPYSFVGLAITMVQPAEAVIFHFNSSTHDLKQYFRIVPGSAHGHSQLKRQNLRVGGYTEKVLKWFNHPRAKAHPRCKVSCHGTKLTCIVGSSVLRRGQPNSGEGCIVLQNRSTHSLISKFPQHSVIACSTRISCYKGRTLQTRPSTGMCEPLMPDVVCNRTIAAM